MTASYCLPAVEDNRAIRFRPARRHRPGRPVGGRSPLPAASAILESLPADTRVRAWLEVQHAEDVQDLLVTAEAEITWLVRDDGAPMAVDAVRASRLHHREPVRLDRGRVRVREGDAPSSRRERGIDRRRVTFVGYWRRGLTEEQLRNRSDRSRKDTGGAGSQIDFRLG